MKLLTVAPIVEEDKDPQKIRRAFAAGAGGVLVSDSLPESVAREYKTFSTQKISIDDTLPILKTSMDRLGEAYWSDQQQGLAATQEWLKEQFEWAVKARLCRTPHNPHGKMNFLKIWLKKDVNLPWHVDIDRIELYPDMHIHIGGHGIHIASPQAPKKIPFSDRRVSPRLQPPGVKDTDSIPQTILNDYLRERGFTLSSMKPGQILFFQEKCLHASAKTARNRLRAAIF